MASADGGNSLEKMLSLLDLFTEANPVWSSDDIIKVFGTSRSTVYRYIKTLHRSGFLTPVGNGSYILGPRILELDRQMRLCDPLYLMSGAVIQTISEQTGWGSLVCVLYSQSVMCIRSEGEPNRSGFFSRGQRRPLFSGAASKIILAHLSIHQIIRLYKTQHANIAASDLGSDWDAFKANLKRIRDDGFCQTTSEYSPGVVGIASPIFNRQGKILGSVGIGARAPRLRPEDRQGLILRVKEAAAEITATMASIETQLDLPARAVGAKSEGEEGRFGAPKVRA